MANEIVRFTLRVDKSLFQKFRYISGYAGRSATREIEQLMKRRVREFEAMYGPVNPDHQQPE